MKRSSIWKLLGLAGLAGLTATGVVVARDERQRRAYTPEEVRARLHERLVSVDGGRGPLPVRSTESQGTRFGFLGRPGVGRRLGRSRSKRV